MLAIFQILTTAFAAFFKYGDVFRKFFENSGLLSKARFGFRIGMYAILIVSFLAFSAALVAFIYYLASSIVIVYNLISTLISNVQTLGGSSSSTVSQPLYAFLFASGLTPAINAVFPFIASSLIFRLLKPLTEYSLKAQAKLIEMLQRYINTTTAA